MPRLTKPKLTKTPSLLSRRHLEGDDYIVDITEHWNPFSQTRRDLYGCIDMLALKGSEKGILAVQATSRGHMKDRIAKIESLEVLIPWKEAGNRFVVHGWDRLANGEYRLKEIYL